MDDNWYVLFVKSGQEAKAADEINACFLKEAEPRILFAETFFKKRGIVKKEKKVIFPGYVFITSSLDNETFILKCRNLVSHSKVLMRILCYGDSWCAALHEEDIRLLKLLWAEQNCLEASRGMMEGDQVKIVEGPFAGKESLIAKIGDLYEHEVDHTYLIKYAGEKIKINPEEVSEIRWCNYSECIREIEENPNEFTEWFKLIMFNEDIMKKIKMEIEDF